MTGKTRQTRKSLIAARWNKIAIVSLLTCAITFPLARAYSATLEAVAKIPSIAPFIAAPAALALILTYRPWRISTFIRLRHVCTHPPLWIGLMLGLSLALWTIGNVDSVATDFGIAKNQDAVIVASCIVGGIPLLLVGLSCAMLPFGRKRKILTPGKHEQGSTSSASNSAQPPSPAKEISSSQLEFTIEDYLKWISDDSAISEPAKDLFGHRGIARHIAKRIESSKAPAQALVGVL